MRALTSEELSEWQAYDRLDPIGEHRDDYRIALLCAVVTNIAISLYGRRGTEHVSPVDFMPRWGEERKRKKLKQSIEDMKKILYSIIPKKAKKK